MIRRIAIQRNHLMAKKAAQHTWRALTALQFCCDVAIRVAMELHRAVVEAPADMRDFELHR